MVATLTGTVPLRSLQIGYETTRGVGNAATAVMPALSVDLNPRYEQSKREEQRGSFIKLYRAPIITKHHVEVGIELTPTFEEFCWWAGLALKGLTSPSSTEYTSVKRWIYSPTAASDDLKTASIEVVTDTQNYTIPFCVVNRLQFGWEAGGPATMQVDLLGQRLTSASKTAALTAITSEEINPANTLAYIDASTIGSTAVTNVVAYSFTVDNGFMPLFSANGTNYPSNFYRGERRSMRTEMTVDFTATTEQAALTAGTIRKIRTKISGTEIAASSPSTNRSLTVDWYGYHEEAPFSTSDGKTQQRFTSESFYDATATYDWSVTVDNAVTTVG